MVVFNIINNYNLYTLYWNRNLPLTQRWKKGLSEGHVICLHRTFLSSTRWHFLHALTPQHSQKRPTRGNISLQQTVHWNHNNICEKYNMYILYNKAYIFTTARTYVNVIWDRFITFYTSPCMPSHSILCFYKRIITRNWPKYSIDKITKKQSADQKIIIKINIIYTRIHS